MKKQFTLSVYSENRIGMLARVCSLFTRRHLNIESLTVCESEIDNVHRYTIVIFTERDKAEKLRLQLEKLVEVFKVILHDEGELLHQEIALYKVKSNLPGALSELLVKENHARFISVNDQSMVIEKTGTREEMQNLYHQLKPFGVLEYVRSGRIAVLKNQNQ